MQPDLKITTEFDAKKVMKPLEKAAFTNLGHAAASIRRDAQKSIQRAPKGLRAGVRRRGGKRVRRARHAASPAGSPPFTQRGQLPRAIVFDVSEQKDSAVVGPRASVVGESATAHEFGGRYKGQEYPERPFMQPALERAIPRFAGSFRGSIGQ